MNLRIFKAKTVSELKNKLSNLEGLTTYYSDKFELNNNDTFPSIIEVDSDIPILNADKESNGDKISAADFDNAIKIYKFLGNLNETVASDPRLWTFLTHTLFRTYTIKRWPLKYNIKEVKEDSEKYTTTKNIILSRWFTDVSDRTLERNAIARLWWLSNLTVAPWEKDKDYFADIKSNDPYLFTRVLFSKQDIINQFLERSFGRSNKLLITLLEYVNENKHLTREQIRDFAKELNLSCGVKKLYILNRYELKEEIKRIGSFVQNK